MHPSFVCLLHFELPPENKEHWSKLLPSLERLRKHLLIFVQKRQQHVRHLTSKMA